MSDFYDWEKGAGIGPEALNEHIRKPMIRARNRRKNIHHLYSPGAATWSLGSAFKLDSVDLLCDGRMLILMANIPAYQSGANSYLYLDIYVPELDIWFSSGTSSPTSFWMQRRGFTNASYVNAWEVFYPWKPPITEEQTLTFELWISCNTATWNVFRGNAYTMFGVMEA